MRSAFQSFIFATLVTLIVVAGGWFYLRARGLSEPIRPPLEHGFLKGPAFYVIAAPPPDDPKAVEFLSEVSKRSKDIVLWINLQAKQSRKLLLHTSATDPNQGLTLSEVLTRFPDHRLVLNFSGNHEGMFEEIMKTVDDAKAGDRVLIQSPEDGLLRDLRDKKPLWLYGTSDAQIVRLKMLSALGLAATATLRGDVMILGQTGAGRLQPKVAPMDYVDTIQEAHRRRMKIFIPENEKEKAVQLRNLGADGVITSKPFDLLDQETR